MVITTLEAHVSPERADELVAAFDASGQELPAAIRESFLVHSDDRDVWRIVTVWHSRDELARYRESVETPKGIVMFRDVGAEPTLEILDVAAHVDSANRGG